MKRILIITALLLAPLANTLCDNWELFPLNQYNLYEVTKENSTLDYKDYIRIKCDSARTAKDTTFLFFNKKYNIYDKCPKLENIEYLESHKTKFMDIDSITKSGNIYSLRFGKASFDINTNLKPKEKCKANDNITIICDSIISVQTFAEEDSVKFLSIIETGNSFRLSKKFGLLEFPEFNHIAYNGTHSDKTLSLSRIDINNSYKGLKLPEFEDYFHLNAGDVLYWYYTYYDTFPGEGLPKGDYYKDSITSSVKHSDYVLYKINRTKSNGDIQFIDKKYEKNKFNKFFDLNTHSGNFYKSFYQFFGDTSFKYYNTKLIKKDNGDWILSYDWYYYTIELNQCRVSGICDAYEKFNLHTRYGISKHNEEEVIGCIISGVAWGDTTAHSGVNDNSSAINLYPNPGNDYIQINNIEKYNNIEILNSLGCAIDFSMNNGRIDVSCLPKGIYIVKLDSKYVKFIKK